VNEPTKIYPIAANACFKIKLAIAVATIVLVFSLLVGFFLGNSWILIGCFIGALVMSSLLIFLFRQWKRSKLEVAPTGLIIHGALGPQPARFPWQSIVEVHIQPSKFGIILDQPFDNPVMRQIAQVNRFHLNLENSSKNRAHLAMAEQRWVPFGQFADWLWQSDLIDAIAPFSPQVAESCRAALEEYPNIGSTRSRWILLFGGIFGLACFSAAGLWGASLIVPSDKTSFWLQVTAFKVGYSIFAAVLMAMIPLLGFFAYSSIRSTIESFRDSDYAEAAFSAGLAIAQAGFAGWIGLALLNSLNPKPEKPEQPVDERSTYERSTMDDFLEQLSKPITEMVEPASD
jgi:hypothetical protein